MVWLDLEENENLSRTIFAGFRIEPEHLRDLRHLPTGDPVASLPPWRARTPTVLVGNDAWLLPSGRAR
jgi:hypothetical protein